MAPDQKPGAVESHDGKVAPKEPKALLVESLPRIFVERSEAREMVDQESSQEERERRPPLDEKRIVGFYWAGALILAVAVRFYLFRHYYSINNDGIAYLEAARYFWQGHWVDGLASIHPPLFPLMIAAVYPVTRDWELAGQFWPLILGVLVLFPLFGLLRRLHGPRVACVALIFYAVSPHLSNLSLEVRSEIPYIFFLVSSFYLFQRGLQEENGGYVFLMGGVSALAYLVRPEGIGIVLVVVTFVLFRGRYLARLERAPLKAAVLVLGFLLFAAPYIFYLRWNTGEWSISRKGGAMVLVGLERRGDTAAQERLQDKASRIEIVKEILARPLAYPRKVLIDAFAAVGFYVKALYPSYLPFLLIGWFLFFRERFWGKGDFVLLVFIFFSLAVLSLLSPSLRYAVPLAALSLGWVGTGYLAAEKFFFEKWGRRGRLATGLTLAVFAILTIPKTLQPVGWNKGHLRNAGLYLREKPGDPTILSGSAQVSFYSAGKNRVISSQDYASLLDMDGDYLALGDKAVNKLAGLFEERGWFVDREFSRRGQGKIVVFRRIASGPLQSSVSPN